MARSTYSVTRAQSQLPQLLRQAERGVLVGIARRDETVAYLLSRDYLEAICETSLLAAMPSETVIFKLCRIARRIVSATARGACCLWCPRSK